MSPTTLTLSTLATFYALTFIGCKSEQNWYNLKLPFNLNPELGFHDQPRTEAEAKINGWTKVDELVDCNGVNKKKTHVRTKNKKHDDKETRQRQQQRTTFWGHRYAPPGEFKEMLLIYDVNGFIAGMQSVVPKEDTLDDRYHNFSSSPHYNPDIINGTEVYLTTAYFVDPNIICNGGRTQTEFDRDGTGYALFFQNGRTPENVLSVPLNASEANVQQQPKWYKHKCIEKMGVHWSQLDHYGNLTCDDQFPVDLVYEQQGDQTIVAFIWKHVAAIKGDRWDWPRAKNLNTAFINPPTCMYDLAETPGLISQHVYLKDYVETCLSAEDNY